MSRIGSFLGSKILHLFNLAAFAIVRVDPDCISHVIGGVQEVILRAQRGSVNTTFGIVSRICKAFLESAGLIDGDGDCWTAASIGCAEYCEGRLG